MSAGRTSVLVGVMLLVLVLAAPAADAAKRTSPAQKQANQAFAVLIRDTGRLPKSLVPKRSRAALVRVARRAKSQARRRPCRAIRTLNAYKRGLGKVKKPRLRGNRPDGGSPRGRLQADALTVNAALLALPGSKRCGGGKASGVTSARTRVLASDARHLRMRVQLPAVQFVAHQVGGNDYLEPTMENMGTAGDRGNPGLPTLTSFFAVPRGATVSFRVNGSQGYDLNGVKLFPRQQEPVDLAPGAPPGAPSQSTFSDPPFKLNANTYLSNRPFPSAPVGASSMGTMRDLQVGGVDFSGGVYRPRSQRLHVYTSMDVTVNFRGNNSGKFATTDILSPWNHAFNKDYGTLANFSTVVTHLDPSHLRFCGEELLIITSPALRPAADTLAAQRTAAGYLTSVKEVGTGAGQIGVTPTEIQTYIRSRLNSDTCFPRPSYVIILGNTANVPTNLVECSPGAGFSADPAHYCDIASDLPYSLNGIGTDLFADVQLGRIPSPDLANANAVVAKLNTYNTTSPAPPGDDMLNHATVTSYFQPEHTCALNAGATGTPNCDGEHPPVTGHDEIVFSNHQDTRGFTITSERVRNAMLADGYTVDRVYTTDDPGVTPETYYDGTPIPSALRRPAFGWDGTTDNLLGDYNDGRFLIFHRDHGWPDGWADPWLHNGHIPLLANGTQLPVVFGVNCASAAFDNPGHPSFVENQVIKPDGGAVAGFGDTRNSPSFANNHMALGFFDALFPSTVPGYGGPETRRLGDILIRGKQYMATQDGIDWQGSGETYVEHYLYHLLGDPTMQMWAAPPVHFDPSRFQGVVHAIRELRVPQPGDPPFYVHFEMTGQPLAVGTQVTLLHDGDPIGRGIVGGDGKVDIVPDVSTDTGSLSVSLQQDGALPASENVEGSKANTKLTQTCPAGTVSQNGTMSISGNLSPAFAGASIVLTYTRPSDGATFERTVQTNANGDWNDSILPSQSDGQGNGVGSWKVRSRFDGDATHNSSSTTDCTVPVA
jgi:hypothetical protein